MTSFYRDDCEKLADFLINLTQHTDIDRDEPGKITFKVSLSAYHQVMKGIDGLDLSAALHSFSGIKNYEFSLFWRTLQIDYDTSIIDRKLWRDLINSRNSQSERQQVKQSLVNLLRDHSV